MLTVQVQLHHLISHSQGLKEADMNKMLKKWLSVLLAFIMATLCLSAVVAFGSDSVAINETNFPDANFREFVKDYETSSLTLGCTAFCYDEKYLKEFLNRIDEIIVFDSLTKPELLQIVELMLKDTVKALADKNISLNVSENAKDFILEKGTNLKYGARPLRRAIQRYVEDEISEMILKGDVHDGQTINVDIKNNELKFNVE